MQDYLIFVIIFLENKNLILTYNLSKTILNSTIYNRVHLLILYSYGCNQKLSNLVNSFTVQNFMGPTFSRRIRRQHSKCVCFSGFRVQNYREVVNGFWAENNIWRGNANYFYLDGWFTCISFYLLYWAKPESVRCTFVSQEACLCFSLVYIVIWIWVFLN